MYACDPVGPKLVAADGINKETIDTGPTANSDEVPKNLKDDLCVVRKRIHAISISYTIYIAGPKKAA